MSIKISQLPNLTAASLVTISDASLPIVGNLGVNLVTYQTTIGNVKTFVETGNLNVTGSINAAADSQFASNLKILGNLIVTGNTSIIGTNNIATTDNIIELHLANAANISQGWTFDDGKDIGIRFHYYNGGDQNAALVFAQDTEYLEWYNLGSEGNTTFTGTSYGSMKMGGLLLTNNTPATANATGALQVSGGISTGGNIWIGGNIVNTGTITSTGSGTVSSLQVNNAATVGTTLVVGSSTTVNSLAINTFATVGTTLVTGGNTTVANLTVNGSSTIGTTLRAAGGIQNTAIGNVTASTGAFTTVSATGGLQNTPIGNATPSTANLTSLTVTGISYFNGNVNTNNIMPFGNANANIGSASLQYNTIFAKATSAQYADLAEKYMADADYEPGTAVVFGGLAEITTTNTYADSRVAGVISTEPAYLMNDGSTGLPVALRGKVPVKIVGPVQKGDLLVTSTTPGALTSVGSFSSGYNPLAVIAKSLTDDAGEELRTVYAVIV